MERTHRWYELHSKLGHRLVNESKWYWLPQFTKDYPSLVYMHLHFQFKSKGWRHPDHIMRLCYRDNAQVPSHSFIQFLGGGWMTVMTYGCAMRAPPRLLMRQAVKMDMHPRFVVADRASDNDFAIFNALAGPWLKEQEKLEFGFRERSDYKTKLDGTSPYDELPALIFP